jgi:hypothetical protein
MSAVIDVCYFNTFILSGENGSYHIEESRIKGDFNGAIVDYGVKAYIVDNKYASNKRKNALRYSGIYNARTGINDTNKFPSGEDITKSVDSSYGAINKIYAEETDLNIFQENKIHAALIDKDAIFTAEGSPINTTSNQVIGQIRSYLGNFGISNYPESFAYHSGRSYFVDDKRACVLRLSRDGITKISDYGVSDFFSDNIKKADIIRGMYDEERDEYVVSLQTSDSNLNSISQGLITDSSNNTLTVEGDFATIGFYEKSRGWTSFYTYKPAFGFSYADKFYTWEKEEENLWQHNNEYVKRSSFYGNAPDPAYVKFVMNQDPSTVKNFLTLNYEGTSGWYASEINCENYKNINYQPIKEEAYIIPKEGTTIIDETGSTINVGFIRKESEYSSYINNKNSDYYNDNTNFTNSGVKGHYLNLTMQYWNTNENTANQIGSAAKIFTVSSEAVFSSK